LQTGNKNEFLSLDFGLKVFGVSDPNERLSDYRRFLYETGAMDTAKGRQIEPEILEKKR